MYRLQYMCCFVFSICGLMGTLILTNLISHLGPDNDESLYDPVAGNPNYASESYPKIIHQVWLNYTGRKLPEAWINASRLSQKFNPEFQYKLWGTHEVQAFLRKSYPWFIATYYGYPYDVQRSNAVRYFILYHYGGVYLDMNDHPNYPIRLFIKDHDVTRYDCVLPAGRASGITDYVFMCKRGSPFMAYVMSRLRHHSDWYVTPDACVSWSTGFGFISARYHHFPNKTSIFVLPNEKMLKYFSALPRQEWKPWDGVFLHFIAYPFQQASFSWGFVLILQCTVVLFVFLDWCFCMHKKKYKCSRTAKKKALML